MTATLRNSESLASGLRRVLLDDVREAGRRVGTSHDLADEDLHEARRALKRARAALRLLRPALDRPAFTDANRRLRDAARPLTHARDARVLLDTLDAAGKWLEDRNAAALLRTLKQTWQAEHRAKRHALTADRATLGGVRGELSHVRGAAGEWTFACDEWPLLSRAVTRIYRKARRAAGAARASPSDEKLHEWRKQVKHLERTLDLLRPVRPGRLGVLWDEAHRIGGWLGDDHDLAVLTEHSSAAVGQDARWGALGARIQARRAELQDRALTLGEQLFATKPKAFVASIEADWRNWRPG